MSPLVIVDTNVVVAGLLSAQPESPVVRILDGMLAASFPFALSAREDLLLITGDKLLQQDAAMGARIVAPVMFVKRWLPRDR